MHNIPGLEKSEYGYEGNLKLEAWAGFQSRNGGYGTQDKASPSDGTCRIFFGPDLNDKPPVITEAHIKAYRYLIENQEAIKDNILKSLLATYGALQATYDYEGEEKEERMPDVSDPADFKRLIGLSNVHLISVEREGQVYVGYEFGCTWDIDHGLGVMTHKDRVIELWGADIAFNYFVAMKDLKTA